MEEQFDLIDYICVSQCIRRGVSREAEDELRRKMSCAATAFPIFTYCILRCFTSRKADLR